MSKTIAELTEDYRQITTDIEECAFLDTWGVDVWTMVRSRLSREFWKEIANSDD